MSKMRKFIIVVLSIIMVTCLTLVGCKDDERFVDFEDTTIEVNFGDQFSVAPYLQVYDVDGKFWPATAVIRDSKGNSVSHIWNIFVIEDTSYTITITIKDGDETIGERVITLQSEDNSPPYINNPLTNMTAFGVINMPVNIPLNFVDYSTDFNYKVEYQRYIIRKDNSGLYVTSLTNKKTATNTTDGASFITDTPGDYKITVTAWDAGETEDTGRVLTFDYPIKEKADSSGDIESFDTPTTAKGNYYYANAPSIGYDGVDGSTVADRYEEINLDTKVNYGSFFYLTDDNGNYIDKDGNVIYTKVVEANRIAFYNTNDELAYYQDKQTGICYDANGVATKYKQGAFPYMTNPDVEGGIAYTTTKYMPVDNAGVIEYWTYTEDISTHVKTPVKKVYYKDATGYKAVSSSSVPGNNIVSETMPYVGRYPDGNVSETMEINQEGELVKKVYTIRTITNLGSIKSINASEDWVQEKTDANGTTKYGVAQVSSGEFHYSTSQASVYLASTTKAVDFYNNYDAKEGESYATWMKNPAFDYISIWVMFETEDPTLETVSCYVHGTTYSSSNRLVVPVNTWYEIKISKFEWRKLNYYPYYTFGSNRKNNPNATIYLSKTEAEKVNIFVDNIAYVKGADLKFDMTNNTYAYGQEVNVDIENCGNFTKEDFIFAYADVRQFTTVTTAANDKMLTFLEDGEYSFTPDFDMSLGYRQVFVYAYLKNDKFIENGYNQIYATAIITVNNFNITMTQETEGGLLINNETTVVAELENSENLEVIVEFEDGTPITLTNGKFTPTQIGYYTVKASATYFGTEVSYEKTFAVLGLVEVTVNAVESTFVDTEDVIITATADGVTSFEYKVVNSLGDVETLTSNTFRPYYTGTYSIRVYAKNASGDVIGLGIKELTVKEPNVVETGLIDGFNSAKSVIAAYKRTKDDTSNGSTGGNYKIVYEGADSVAPNTTWLKEFEGKKGVIKTKPQETMAGVTGANGIYLRSSVWRSSADYKGLLYDESASENLIEASSNEKWDYVGFMIYLPKENAEVGETHLVSDYYGYNPIEVPYNTWFEFKLDKISLISYFTNSNRVGHAFSSASTSSNNALQSCILLSNADQEIYIDYIKTGKYSENDFSSFDITLVDGDSAGTSIISETQVNVNGATKFKVTATIDATDDNVDNPTEIDYSKLELVWFHANGANSPSKVNGVWPFGKTFTELYTVTNNNEFTFATNTSTSKAMVWLVKYVDETSGMEFYKHVCGFYIS